MPYLSHQSPNRTVEGEGVVMEKVKPQSPDRVWGCMSLKERPMTRGVIRTNQKNPQGIPKDHGEDHKSRAYHILFEVVVLYFFLSSAHRIGVLGGEVELVGDFLGWRAVEDEVVGEVDVGDSLGVDAIEVLGLEQVFSDSVESQQGCQE